VASVSKAIQDSVDNYCSGYAHPIAVTKDLIGRPHCDLDVRNLAALLLKQSSASPILQPNLENLEEIFEQTEKVCDDLGELVSIAWKERFDIICRFRTRLCLQSFVTNVQSAMLFTSSTRDPPMSPRSKAASHDVRARFSNLHQVDYFAEYALSNLAKVVIKKNIQLPDTYV
jgi:hypothetical protein